MKKLGIVFFSLLFILSVILTVSAANKADIEVETSKIGTAYTEGIGALQITVDKSIRLLQSGDAVEITLMVRSRNRNSPNTGDKAILLPTILMLISSGALILLSSKRAFKALLAVALVVILLPLSQSIKAANFVDYLVLEDWDMEMLDCFDFDPTSIVGQTNVALNGSGDGLVWQWQWNGIGTDTKKLTYVMLLKDTVADAYVDSGQILVSETALVFTDFDGVNKGSFVFPDVYVDLFGIYTLRYHPNDGSSSAANTGPRLRSGSATKVADNMFTNPGFIFVGWNTKADGTGDDYDPNEQINLTSDIDLYAQWTPDTTIYTVTYMRNNGPGDTEMIVLLYTAGDVHTVLNQVQAWGENAAFLNYPWNLEAWYYSADWSGPAVSAGANITVSGNIVLYGKWDNQG